MSEENKNIKDTYIKDSNNSITDTNFSSNNGQGMDGEGSSEMCVVSYTKTNKLITALYMVTDIIDKDEPLRNKLRMLGSDVISDTCTISVSSHMSKQTTNKISEIISFLDIASTVGMISEMNCSILKKEFVKLRNSLQENYGQGLSLSSLFSTQNEVENHDSELKPTYETKSPSRFSVTPQIIAGEKISSTRIGVQSGSTLLKALSQVTVSDRKNKVSDRTSGGRTSAESKNKVVHQTGENDFDVLKKKRREEIIKIVRENKVAYPAAGGATITDIRTGAKGVLVACGEKTLQRELVSMVKDSILNKIGEKRWSRYLLRT